MERRKTTNEYYRHHRRSKSAPESSFGLSKDEALHCTTEGWNHSQTLQQKSRRNRTPLNEDLINRRVGISPNNCASLEKDIKQIELHFYQERCTRNVHKAIDRASSTFSPGHRHFSTQTRELMAEIELLEEEIASREQHVLSLYQSIFNQYASRSAPSSEISSSVASPKSRPRKHPSVISTSFCSSNKFPFQHFQFWVLKKEKLESGFMFKPKSVYDNALSTGDVDNHFGSAPNSKKVRVDRKSHLNLSLKEHLQRSPNKISEEMIRCMVSAYCLLNSEKNEKEKKCSPFLSRSSTTVVFPRRSNGSNENLFRTRKTVEISPVWAGKYQISDASSAIKSYSLLVEQLERIDPSDMEWGAKCAFWLNIYNSLVMHAYLAYGAPKSSLRRILLFQKAAYNIGGQIVTASSIEHFIFHLRTPRVGRWIETLFLTAIRKKNGEEKQLTESHYALQNCEPVVLFALCTGASSDPMLRVYTPKNIYEELEKAKVEFLQANVVIKKTERVLVPKIVERYGKEASLSYEQILKWVSNSLDRDKSHDFMHNFLDSKSKKKASQIIEWLPYNTRFRYVFANNLTQTRLGLAYCESDFQRAVLL